MPGCSRSGLLVIMLLWAGCAFAAPAVLIEQRDEKSAVEPIESENQGEPEWNRPDLPEETERKPAAIVPERPIEARPEDMDDVVPPYEELGPSSQNRRPLEPEQFQSFASLSEFRLHRRVGVGGAFLGRAGFIGMDVELNVHASHSVLASVGGGPGYNAAAVGYKWTPFEGRWHPTFGVSMAGWTADDLRLNRETTIPEFFRPRSGQANETKLRQVYLIPSLGLQTVQLSGPGVGGLLFVEVLFFAALPTFDLRPIGSVGAKYFF